jgi:hypothetical protein
MSDPRKGETSKTDEELLNEFRQEAMKTDEELFEEMRRGKHDPLNDLRVPSFNFPKEEMDNFMPVADFLDGYRKHMQAVFWNLLALVLIALICFGGLSIVEANTQRDIDLANFSSTEHAPWWCNVLEGFSGVVLFISLIYFGRNILFYGYWSVTRFPRYLEGKRIRRDLIAKLRAESMAWDEAYMDKLMSKVAKELDPKMVDEMRKAGLL